MKIFILLLLKFINAPEETVVTHSADVPHRLVRVMTFRIENLSEERQDKAQINHSRSVMFNLYEYVNLSASLSNNKHDPIRLKELRNPEQGTSLDIMDVTKTDLLLATQTEFFMKVSIPKTPTIEDLFAIFDNMPLNIFLNCIYSQHNKQHNHHDKAVLLYFIRSLRMISSAREKLNPLMAMFKNAINFVGTAFQDSFEINSLFKTLCFLQGDILTRFEIIQYNPRRPKIQENSKEIFTAHTDIQITNSEGSLFERFIEVKEGVPTRKYQVKEGLSTHDLSILHFLTKIIPKNPHNEQEMIHRHLINKEYMQRLSTKWSTISVIICASIVIMVIGQIIATISQTSIDKVNPFSVDNIVSKVLLMMQILMGRIAGLEQLINNSTCNSTYAPVMHNGTTLYL